MSSPLFGKTRFLFEADDDTPDEGFSSGGVQQEEPAADESNNEETPAEDSSSDEANEDTGEASNEEDPTTDEPSDDDFNIDSDMDEPEDGGEDSGSDDSGESDSSSSDDSSDEVTVSNSKLKETEKELFDSLSPEEQKIKIKELKNLYMELYTNCNNLIDKLNSISTELDDVNIQIKKVINVLFETKRMISDYVLNIFDSKSFIENDIMFNNYLRVFNSVKNITKDIKNMYKGDNEGK